MRRREAIAGLAAAAFPLSASGQEANRVLRDLSAGGPGSGPPGNEAASHRAWARARRAGMDRGQQSSCRAPICARRRGGACELAQELVALQPDVILAHTVSVTAALRGETRAIPIVFVKPRRSLGRGLHLQPRAVRREPDRVHDVRGGHLGQVARDAQGGYAGVLPG